jgi:hypothetical protein
MFHQTKYRINLSNKVGEKTQSNQVNSIQKLGHCVLQGKSCMSLFGNMSGL